MATNREWLLIPFSLGVCVDEHTTRTGQCVQIQSHAYQTAWNQKAIQFQFIGLKQTLKYEITSKKDTQIERYYVIKIRASLEMQKIIK